LIDICVKKLAGKNGGKKWREKMLSFKKAVANVTRKSGDRQTEKKKIGSKEDH
jgi:hypothetical protein